MIVSNLTPVCVSVKRRRFRNSSERQRRVPDPVSDSHMAKYGCRGLGLPVRYPTQRGTSFNAVR